jgi:hypothetical protein
MALAYHGLTAVYYTGVLPGLIPREPRRETAVFACLAGNLLCSAQGIRERARQRSEAHRERRRHGRSRRALGYTYRGY